MIESPHNKGLKIQKERHNLAYYQILMIGKTKMFLKKMNSGKVVD